MSRALALPGQTASEGDGVDPGLAAVEAHEDAWQRVWFGLRDGAWPRTSAPLAGAGDICTRSESDPWNLLTGVGSPPEGGAGRRA